MSKNERYLEPENLELHCKFTQQYSLLAQGRVYNQLKINFSMWIEEGNPDYLDQIVLLCADNHIVISGVLLEQLGVASFKRLKKEYTGIYRQKKSKINLKEPIEQVHWHIFKLNYFCGKTVELASNMSAGWLDYNFPEYQLKASTIDKEHPNWCLKHSDEIEYVKSTRPDMWTKTEQNKYLSQFPAKISPSLKGNRR